MSGEAASLIIQGEEGRCYLCGLNLEQGVCCDLESRSQNVQATRGRRIPEDPQLFIYKCVCVCVCVCVSSCACAGLWVWIGAGVQGWCAWVHLCHRVHV